MDEVNFLTVEVGVPWYRSRTERIGLAWQEKSESDNEASGRDHGGVGRDPSKAAGYKKKF